MAFSDIDLEYNICYNCDNFVKTCYSQKGQCLINGKEYKDSHKACKNFTEDSKDGQISTND